MSLLRLAIVTALIASLAAPAAGQTKPAAKRPPAKASTRAPPEPPPPPYVPADQMKTSDQIKRESVAGAVTTPLRDLNLDKTEIPEVLRQALSDPYARPPRNWRCPALIALIRPLNDVLGPDLDVIPPGDENLMDRSRSTALGAAADLASSAIIPFRGVVRKLSGAEGHDRLVQSAIVAGNVRRAYLKGLGESKGCNPPGTPSHERAGSAPVVVERRGPTPKYPTRTQPAEPQTSAGKSRAAPPKPRS